MTQTVIKNVSNLTVIKFPVSLRGLPGADGGDFDIDAWAADLVEYDSNDEAVLAIGTNKIYCAGAAHQAAARGTLMRTF